MSKHWQGPKFTKSHTTAIEAATPLLRLAQSLPGVKKIALGPINKAGPGRFSVKYTEYEGHLRVKLRGPVFVQTFWIYCADPRFMKHVFSVTIT